MTLLTHKTTTAQASGQFGRFWGRNISDICIGDKLIHDGELFVVEDVHTNITKGARGTIIGARIKVADASLCMWGDIQNAPQWFNQDANIEWL